MWYVSLPTDLSPIKFMQELNIQSCDNNKLSALNQHPVTLRLPYVAKPCGTCNASIKEYQIMQTTTALLE